MKKTLLGVLVHTSLLIMGGKHAARNIKATHLFALILSCITETGFCIVCVRLKSDGHKHTDLRI